MAAILNGLVDPVAFAMKSKIGNPDFILPGGLKYNQKKLVPVWLHSNRGGTTSARLIDKDGALYIGLVGYDGFIENQTISPVSSGYASDDFIYIKKMNKKAVLQFGPIVAKNFQYKDGKYHLEYVDTLGHSGQINVKKSK